MNEKETQHKLEVGELEMRINDLETELSMVKNRYESLCGVLKKGANDERNETVPALDDDFLTSYNQHKDFF
jgi:hypothetical protein